MKTIILTAVCLASGPVLAADSHRSSPQASVEPAYTPIDLTSPVRIRYRTTLTGHQERAHGLAFSPDGKLLVSSGSTHSAGSNQKQKTLVHDLATGRILHAFPSTYGATDDVAFSPQGDEIATAEDDGQIQFFNPRSGERIRSFRTGEYSEGVPALSYLPDGKRLVIATNRRGGIALWQSDGKKLHESTIHTSRAWDLAVSPDGRWSITGSADGTFAIWNTTSGKLAHQSPSQKTWVTALAISPDSKTVAVGDYYSNLRLWDIASCRPVLDIRVDQKNHMAGILSLAFSLDGNYLVSSEEAHHGPTTRVWDVRTGKLLGQLDTRTEMVLNMKFSPDGRTLALACPNGSVKLYDWEPIPVTPDRQLASDECAPCCEVCPCSRSHRIRVRQKVFSAKVGDSPRRSHEHGHILRRGRPVGCWLHRAGGPSLA